MYLLLVVFLIDRHIGLILIQIEGVSLFLLALVIEVNLYRNFLILIIFILFCVIVSEAALGLSLLLVNSRLGSKEIMKHGI